MDHSPRPFVSISEHFPFWLLGLEPSMVSTLHFPGIRNAEALRNLATINGTPNALITKAVTHLGLGRVRFNSIGLQEDLRLVSGSLDFLYQFGASAPDATKALLLVDKPWRVGRLPKQKASSIRWVRKDHSKFGGATDYCYLFGVLGLALDPVLSTLARSIGHVFDHSLPPSTTVVELPIPAYTLNSQLKVNSLTLPVGFKTQFARRGWGLRSLNPDELGISFGLPHRLRLGVESGSIFPLPPVQGLIGWLGALTSSTRVASTLPKIQPRKLKTPPTSTWFPCLSLALSHAWIDTTTVSDKAVKHNDADAPVQL
jgi:hypothetical protein